MGTRMRTVGVALAIALVLPLIVATAALVYAATFDSSVSINYDRPNFEGRVRSERERCERGRKVRVFKKRKGPDRLIGTDETNDNGFYSVNKPGARGRFYAQVARLEFGGYQNRHVCRGDTSGTIRVRRNNN